MSKQERLKTAFQYLKSIGAVHTQKDVAEAMGASEPNVSSAFKGVEKVLTDLSTYWSRHTWATIAYEICIPVDIIGQALGHSDKSHSVTFIYIKEDPVKVDEANRRVLDYIKKISGGSPRY